MEEFFDKMQLEEKQIDSSKVFDGRLLQVYLDHVQLPKGTTTTREYIKHVGAVAVVAIDDKNRIVMENQFRYPFGKEILEIPAGKLDGPDEDPLEAAKRELLEETGITASEYRYIGPLYPTVAYSTEVIHLYWAKGLSFGKRHLDTDESINVRFMDFEEVVQMVLDGRIEDSKTQAAVLKVKLLK